MKNIEILMMITFRNVTVRYFTFYNNTVNIFNFQLTLILNLNHDKELHGSFPRLWRRMWLKWKSDVIHFNNVPLLHCFSPFDSYFRFRFSLFQFLPFMLQFLLYCVNISFYGFPIILVHPFFIPLIIFILVLLSYSLI